MNNGRKCFKWYFLCLWPYKMKFNTLNLHFLLFYRSFDSLSLWYPSHRYRRLEFQNLLTLTASYEPGQILRFYYPLRNLLWLSTRLFEITVSPKMIFLILQSQITLSNLKRVEIFKMDSAVSILGFTLQCRAMQSAQKNKFLPGKVFINLVLRTICGLICLSSTTKINTAENQG